MQPRPTPAAPARALLLLAGLPLLAACGATEFPPVIDRDGDQWTADVDCDDTDPTVHPFADELCDSVDNDCDGETDEEHAIDKPTWYADADGDGYGSATYTWALCEQPVGYVDNADDCDDLDAEFRPGAVEICDQRDNDCDGEVDEPGVIDPQTWYADADGDGYGDAAVRTEGCLPPTGYTDNPDDCDDQRGDVNPDAPEVCDPFDVDENCNGLADDLDPEPTGLTTWYLDEDGDSHGDERALEVLTACEQPESYALTADDCDDLDRTVNPSSREVCGDLIDNDCNGLIDGEDSARDVDWWADVDGDGFGDESSYWGKACDNPGGQATNPDDCDDTDAAVNPDATETWYDGVDADCAEDDDFDADKDGDPAAEHGGGDCDDGDPTVRSGINEICGDLIDNDCDGVVDACEVTGVLVGAAGGDTLGGALAAAGDRNGDGRSDWLVGADREDTNGAGAGAVYVMLGAVSGEADVSTQAVGVLRGEALGDHAGIAVAGPGDVDGDGIADLLIGAYDTDHGGAGAGSAYVVSGPVSGESDLSAAIARLDGEAAGDQAGYAVAGPGDVDGDGFADILVGAFENDDNGAASGAVYLFEGPVTGNYRLWAADARILGELAGDQAGWVVDGAGDVDGDGLDDLLIGAPYEHADGVYTGAAYLVLGAPRGTFDLTEADAKLKGSTAGDLAGYAVSGGGDVDGDGYDDLVVAAPESDLGGSASGAVYVVLGPVSASAELSSAQIVLVGENTDDQAGAAVDLAPDVDGDGLHDLIVGARLDDSEASDAGAAYIVRGLTTGTLDLGAQAGKVRGAAIDDAAGAAVAGLGDVNGDSFGDVAVGVPFVDASPDAVGRDAGEVWLLFGGGWPTP